MKTLILTALLMAVAYNHAYAETPKSAEADASGLKKAIFAGGCFWCMESEFEDLDGIHAVTSGYTGGKKEKPTYEEVSRGATGHAEAVEITYDPAKVDYAKLLDIYWGNIDPTQKDGQFADHGSQYRTAIFYHDGEQKKLAEGSKKALADSGKFKDPIVTEVVPASAFYKAEEYHQDYYKKEPERYQRYKKFSGREAFLKKTKAAGEKSSKGTNNKEERPEKMSKQQPKEKLSSIQYHVTQEGGTETPFNNEYWNNKKEGIYVDVVSGQPLFSSTDKYDSGTGWPSFTKPLKEENVVEKQDLSAFMVRTEVKSQGGSHLGHVFDDGPGPTGKRFCINSASLHFIPKEDLEKEGYGQYKDLFK